VAADGREVPYVDTHDHFTHTRRVDPAKFPYFKRRGAAPEVVLTFDCAWVPKEAGAEVLDALREMGVKATFFVAGPFVTDDLRKSEPGPNRATLELVRRIVDEGHEVGNHTRNHPHLAAGVSWSDELGALAKSWEKATREAYAPASPPAAATMKPYWRAPYGEYDERSLSAAAVAGYPLHFGWNVDVLDSIGLPACRSVAAGAACLDADRETRHVLSFVHENPTLDVVVVLAHLGAPYGFGKDPKGLRALITKLRAEGRTFAKLSEVVVSP
jgi:peptidoglycan/xylan/chitin deacetylase (PgdA/CDA1 family)